MVDNKNKILKLGKSLMSFRTQKGITKPDVAELCGVSSSCVNDLENGIRTAGCKTLNKIARGLELNDEDRFRLILKGLELSKRDFVIPDFAAFPPEIINFLPYILAKNGIQPKRIKNVELAPDDKSGIQITTTDDLTLSIEIKLTKKN
jgi:transcriptional regulator with XRE-family HTH domain